MYERQFVDFATFFLPMMPAIVQTIEAGVIQVRCCNDAVQTVYVIDGWCDKRTADRSFHD